MACDLYVGLLISRIRMTNVTHSKKGAFEDEPNAHPPRSGSAGLRDDQR
jgi:hypothetical protein